MKRFKYSIFDLDGTLLDSMSAWRNLGRDYLLSKDINPPENLNKILASMSMAESAEYFKQAFNFNISSKVIIAEVNELITYKYRNDFVLKPFVKEYLQKLKDENVKMSIATATSLKLAKMALERNDIIDYFQFVLSCDEIGVGKNKPDIFFMAANKLGGNPESIAVYEDADFALITAKEAGFFTIGVYDESFKDKREDIESISNIYIESFKELLYN
ncbi:MAG: HAD-IA family hydrolase [Tissierellia bacterium]|nr:HAD-IA family hydrolase [Tissierellia bacterium]